MNWYVIALCLIAFILGALTHAFVIWVAMRNQVIAFLPRRRRDE